MNNSLCETKLRRYRYNLEKAGGGYILFGVWSVLKLFMTVSMHGDEYRQITSEVDLSELSDPAVKLALALIVIIISFFIILLHLYIGLSAVRFARTGRKWRGFVIMACIFMAGTISSLPSYFSGNADISGSNDSLFAGLLVDLTVIYIFFEMIRSVYMIKKLSAGEQKKGGGQ